MFSPNPSHPCLSPHSARTPSETILFNPPNRRPNPQKGKPPMPNPPPTRHRPPRSCRVRTADQITYRGPPCGPYVKSKCTENE